MDPRQLAKQSSEDAAAQSKQPQPPPAQQRPQQQQQQQQKVEVPSDAAAKTTSAPPPGPMQRQTSGGRAQKPAPIPQGVVAPTLGYVLDKLPGAVTSRVRPVYTTYAEPAALKVDGVLTAAATRGLGLLGGAKARIFKVESRDNLPAMNKPGLLARAVGACERAVDRILPPPAAPPAEHEKKPNGDSSESDVDPEDLSSFRRFLNLAGVAKTRTMIHAEVKYIVLKVNAKVWFDLNVVPPCASTLALVKALPDGARRRALAVRDPIADRYGRARRAVTNGTTAVTTRCSGLKTHAEAKLLITKKAAQGRIVPILAAAQAKAAPLTLRLNAGTQTLLAAERRCVAYVVAKLRMLKDGLRARTAPVEAYAGKKYAAVKEGAAARTKHATETLKAVRAQAAKRTADTMGAVSSRADRILLSTLGKDRSAKVQGLAVKYASIASKAVGVHQA